MPCEPVVVPSCEPVEIGMDRTRLDVQNMRIGEKAWVLVETRRGYAFVINNRDSRGLYLQLSQHITTDRSRIVRLRQDYKSTGNFGRESIPCTWHVELVNHAKVIRCEGGVEVVMPMEYNPRYPERGESPYEFTSTFNDSLKDSFDSNRFGLLDKPKNKQKPPKIGDLYLPVCVLTDKPIAAKFEKKAARFRKEAKRRNKREKRCQTWVEGIPKDMR